MTNPYMGESTARGTVQLPYPLRAVTAEVAGDFTLPDYQPEIKRLLRIGVNLLPPDPDQAGGDLTGRMDYSVLYVGGDGGIYCAPLSTEYRLEIPTEGHTGSLRSASAICPPRYPWGGWCPPDGSISAVRSRDG